MTRQRRPTDLGGESGETPCTYRQSASSSSVWPLCNCDRRGRPITRSRYAWASAAGPRCATGVELPPQRRPRSPDRPALPPMRTAGHGARVACGPASRCRPAKACGRAPGAARWCDPQSADPRLPGATAAERPAKPRFEGAHTRPLPYRAQGRPCPWTSWPGPCLVNAVFWLLAVVV